MIRRSIYKNVLATVSAIIIATLVAISALSDDRKPMPPFVAGEWISEEKVTAEDLEGRPYVLEFWATWCAPCLESIPHLVEMAEEYQPKGLIIIGMSTDWPQDIDKVREFYKDFEMNYPVAMDTELEAKLGVRAIPAAFLVDQSGMIAWQGHPMDPKFEEEIQRQLNEWVVKLEDFDELKPLAQEILRKGGKETIDRLIALTEEGEHADEAKRLKASIEKLAELQLEKAQKTAEENPVEAIGDFDKLATRYEGLEAATKAAGAAEAIRNDPGFADEKAVTDKLAEMDKRFEGMFREKTAEPKDQREFMLAAAEVLEEYVKEIGELVDQYPDAKAIERAKATQKDIETTLNQIRQALDD